MSKTIRMADIAARLGVSTVTVSKALSGKEGVSEELRDKIKSLAAEMGYKNANCTPSAKTQTGTGNIGILVPSRFLSKNNSFYWNMYERIISRLMSYGYYGFLELISQENEDNLNTPRLIKDKKADGLIAIGQFSTPYMCFLRQQRSNIPIVFLDSYDAQSGEDSVISDGYYGMYTMTSHLIKNGHKNIYFLGTINATSSISDRYFGYCRAMSEHKIVVTDNMLIPDRDEHGNMDFNLPEQLPSAFACNCDIAAYHLISLLNEKGLQVPGDISVVGFDDYSPPSFNVPHVTTYAVDMDNMTRICVEWIIRKIHNKNYTTNLRIVSGKLIEKDSVKNIAL